MKYIAMAFLALCVTSSVIADDHGANLIFEPRQNRAPMTLTSIHLSKGGGVITAVGNMGKYGRVYTTYTLSADSGGLQGTVLGEGRGAMEDGTFASGSGSGSYTVKGRNSLCTFCSKSVTALRILTKSYLMLPQVS